MILKKMTGFFNCELWLPHSIILAIYILQFSYFVFISTRNWSLFANVADINNNDFIRKLRRDNMIAKYEYLAIILQTARKLRLAESLFLFCYSIFAWFTGSGPKLSNTRMAKAKCLQRKIKEELEINHDLLAAENAIARIVQTFLPVLLSHLL